MHTCLIFFLKERMLQSCRLSIQPSVLGVSNPCCHGNHFVPHSLRGRAHVSFPVCTWYDYTVLSYCNFYPDTLCDVVTLTFDLLTLESCHMIRAVRRRTGGRRRRWVILWPAAAARRAFFIGGGGVGLWLAASRASDRMREHWNSALAGQAFFFWFYRGQPLHLWSPLGRWRRKVNCEYAFSAQFHSLNELFIA